MRIFYAADDAPHPHVPSRIWYYNLYLPLVDLGHEIVRFDYDLGPAFQHLDVRSPVDQAFMAEHRPALEAELLRQIRKAHRERPIDLFFSYFYSAVCRPEVIREIGALGIRTVNWYCNASYQFHLVEELAPAYDHCFVPERFRLGDYRRAGARPIYVQEAANPAIYTPRDVGLEYDVTFVGQCYGDRPTFVRHLLDAGIDVRVWGHGWRAPAARRSPLGRVLERVGLRRDETGPVPARIAGPPLSDDELVAMYGRSRVSLGFSSCGETHAGGERILQVRLRDFEAPMSGAFYMVEHMDELGEFFELGREIVTYRDAPELADKARYYLDHPAERDRIRRAGMRRALAEHTWHRRFETAFEAIGLPPRGDAPAPAFSAA
jgi:hypothetical protein